MDVIKQYLSMENLLSVADVILRVPGLFILEIWYRTEFDRAWAKGPIPVLAEGNQVFANILFYAVFAAAIVILFLNLEKLINLYLHLVSAGLIILSYTLSYRYLTNEGGIDAPDEKPLPLFENHPALYRLGMNLVIQIVLASFISYLLQLKDWKRFLLLGFTVPMVSRVLNLAVTDLLAIHSAFTLLYMLVVLLFVFNKIGAVVDTIKNGLNHAYVLSNVMGYLPLAIHLWNRFYFGLQFLLFWCILLVVNFYFFYWKDSVIANKVFTEGFSLLVLASIAEGCVTPVSLVGLCVSISYFSWFVLILTKLFLKGWDGLLFRESRGWTEGFTMLLLGVQTDIMDLKPTQRVFLMGVVLFIVVLSLIQSMYEITDPILLALSASHSKDYSKHIRAVLMSTFLWMFPLFMTYTICQFFDLDSWLMIIVSSCILTSLQVLGSLTVYALFIYESMLSETWENLDDVVYYVKSVTRVLEFIVAVFVVLYGIKESVFGEWNLFSTSILIFHFYYNVWQRLQTGWKMFLQRREAVHKIASLPDATPEELSDLNDICSICFQEMTAAKVTPCKHFFHSICLRKWLYVQSRCPICHQDLNFNEPNSEDAGENAEGAPDNVVPETDSDDDDQWIDIEMDDTSPSHSDYSTHEESEDSEAIDNLNENRPPKTDNKEEKPDATAAIENVD